MKKRIAYFILNAWHRNYKKVFWFCVGCWVGRYDATGHFTTLDGMSIAGGIVLGVAILLLLVALQGWYRRQA